MTGRPVLAWTLAALVLLAGCLGASPDPTNSSGDNALEPQNRTNGTDGNNASGDNRSDQGDEDPNDPENESGEDRGENETSREDPNASAWPAPGEASVRPGVQLFIGDGQCTSNFLFRTPDNHTLLLGTAAHCVVDGPSNNVNGCSEDQEAMPLGTEVRIQGANEPGRLAYSSWLTMQAVGEGNEDACRYNDFALVALHPDTRDQVHPAMLHFGGPEGMAGFGGVGTGDKVLSYGNSGLRAGVEPSNWHEGYVVGKNAGWTLTTYTVSPGLPGDSGSGVLTGDGQALGVVSTVELAPRAGSNGVTALEPALTYAQAHGMDVELVSWKVLDDGVLP